MTPEMFSQITQVAAAAAAARHGQREPIYRDACARLGISRASLMRLLSQTAARAPRKQRSDAGASAMSFDEAHTLGTYLLQGYRQNDKRMMSVETAVSALRANGIITAGRVDPNTGEFLPLSNAAILRALSRYQCHPEQMREVDPHIALRSLFPNHVWQVDASVCTLYYLPTGYLIETHKAVHYKNKPQNLERIAPMRIIRYVVVDHCSGVIRWRYYPHSESGEHTARFLAWAMAKKADRNDPFHGAPFIVMVDPGATASGLVKRFCDRLSIELRVTRPGAPRSKGSVECAQNLVETEFEQGLRFTAHKIASIDDLNAMCEPVQLGFNATRKHTRTGKPRFAVWLTIRPDQLRLTPPEEELAKLIYDTPEPRVVADDLTVSFGGARYRVNLIPRVIVGQKLDVFRSALRDAVFASVLDLDGHERHFELPKVERDAYGFDIEGAVIGDQFKAHADTPLEKAKKAALLKAAEEETLEAAQRKTARKNFVPFGGKIDPFKPWTDQPSIPHLPRRGEALEVKTPRIETPPITRTAFLLRLKREHGITLAESQRAWLEDRFPEGIPEDQAASLTEQFTGSERKAGGARS